MELFENIKIQNVWINQAKFTASVLQNAALEADRKERRAARLQRAS